MDKKQEKKTLLAKQKIFIIVLSSLVLVAAILCIVLPRVFTEEKQTVYAINDRGDYVFSSVTDVTGTPIGTSLENQANGSEKNIWNVKRGEDEKVLYTFNLDGVKITERPFIFKEILLDDVERVRVKTSGSEICVYKYEGSFIIEGAEKNLYNTQTLSSLLFQARYMLAIQYVENPGKLSDYGLDEASRSAVVEITDKNGRTEKVFVGNTVMNGSGYYMKHAEKDYIYIMDSSASAFFEPIINYLSPAVIKPIQEQQRNYIEKFALAKGGVPFFACEILPEEAQTGIYANQLHRMTYPEPEHVLNTYTLYEMFSQVGALSGAAVVEFGVSKSENADQIKAFYGLDAPAADISFSYGGQNYVISVGRMENAGDMNYYYVYSEYQDTIVLVPETSLAFLQYELVDLYQENVFQYNINEIASVEVKYGDNTYNYSLDGEGKQLAVTETLSGKMIDTASFRQFYISLMNVTIGGYSSLEGATYDMLKHELTYTVTFKEGSKLIYEFYSESTMSCYMIADGKGGFKTDRKWIDTIIKHSDMLMKGEIITSQLG